MTIELHLPVFETLRIDACCRAAGLDFAAILARYANIITGAHQPAEEDPAVLTALNLPAAPVAAAANYPGAQPARLGRPGEPILLTEEQAAAMDWEALCR